MNSSERDAALAEGLCRRDPDALAEIYRQHAGAVFGHARQRLGSSAAAEDVVQEIFLRLWQTPGGFDASRGNMRSFLLTQARYRSVDLYRSERAKSRRQERYVRDSHETVAVDDQVVLMVESDRMHWALSRLEPGERSAIEMAYFGGHTYRQVAHILGEPEGTIKSRIRVGLRRLRALNSSQLEEPMAAVG